MPAFCVGKPVQYWASLIPGGMVQGHLTLTVVHQTSVGIGACGSPPADVIHYPGLELPQKLGAQSCPREGAIVVQEKQWSLSKHRDRERRKK